MNRIEVKELVELMENWSERYGECCYEYVGYGEQGRFLDFLISKGYMLLENEEVDGRCAYLDTFHAVGIEDEAELQTQLLIEYIINYSSDQAYEKFIQYLQS